MTPTQEKIKVMEAYNKGAEIEVISNIEGIWRQEDCPGWDWATCTYRIKPKPKQKNIIEKWLVTNGRRFDTAETSDIDEYLGEGFGWIKVKLLHAYEVEL